MSSSGEVAPVILPTMNPAHKKTPVNGDRGYSGAIGKPGKAPVTLRFTAISYIEANRHEIII